VVLQLVFGERVVYKLQDGKIKVIIFRLTGIVD
jgi:hypothetical protein